MPDITQRLLAARGISTINAGLQRGDLNTGRGFDYPPEYYGNRGRGYTGVTGTGMGGQPEVGMHGGADYGLGSDVVYDPFTQSYGSYDTRGLAPGAEGVAPGPAYSNLPLSSGSPQHPFDVQSAGPISPEVITSLADIAGPSTGQNIPPNEDVGPGLQNQWWRERGVSGGRAQGPMYPVPGGGPGGPRAGDWEQSASGMRNLYTAPAVSTQGSAGIGGQGGSYFTTQAGGTGDFDQSGAGRNEFGNYFPQSGGTGLRDKGLYDALMKGSGWADLFRDMNPHQNLDLSYQTYLRNNPPMVNPIVPQLSDEQAGSNLWGLKHTGQNPQSK